MYSVRLTDAEDEEITGYVRKEFENGKKLFELLKDGKRHSVVLEIAYAKRSQNSSVVTITDMLSKSWYEYPEEQP